MVSSLYVTLRGSLLDLAQTNDQNRQTQLDEQSALPVLPPIPRDELQAAVSPLWESAWAEYAGSQSAEGKERVEMVRSVMDLVGRDVVVSPLTSTEVSHPVVAGDIAISEAGEDASEVDKCRFQTAMQDRLDIVLTLFEVVYGSIPGSTALEPGAVFIPLLEDLVELVSVDSWRTVWGYVETRSKRFTKDMPASRGKALPLLRTINAFLRFLPRTPADLVFRGRVHQFASSVISVADKSAINMRGDYNDIKTTWEQEEEPQSSVEETSAAEAGVAEDGDVQMKEEKEVDSKPEIEQKAKEPDFYSTLWSLQQYFASPPSLEGPPSGEPPQTPFQRFTTQTNFVLPKLFEQTQREKEMMGKEADDGVVGQKRKRAGGDEGFFHPRYLTGKRLLEHELADPSFRRQILVQYFILFQFLLNLVPASVSKQVFTGGMPKSFVLSADDETWVKSTVGSIRDELKRMAPDGTRFEETVLSIITRERHYVSNSQAQWKNDGCPEDLFEVAPLSSDSAKDAARLWEQRLGPVPQYPFRVGTRALTRVWARGFRNIDQLKSWKRLSTYEGLDEDIQRIEMDEEDDKAMGKEPSAEEAAASAIAKTKLNWRALRHASHTQLRHFAALGEKRDIHVLTRAIKTEEEARAEQLRAGANAGDVAEAESAPPGTPIAEEPSNELAEGADAAEVADEVAPETGMEAIVPVEEADVEGTKEVEEDEEEKTDEIVSTEVEEGAPVAADDVLEGGEESNEVATTPPAPEGGMDVDEPSAEGITEGQSTE